MSQPTNPKTPEESIRLPAGYRLEAASWRDLPALQRLERLCFPKDAWPWIELLQVLTWPGVVRYKISQGNSMVGFVAGQEIDQAGWIVTVAVHPAHRRRGLGQALVTACEAGLPQQVLRLAVRASNYAALALYERNGYRVIDRWRRYYVDREDALIMEKIRIMGE